MANGFQPVDVAQAQRRGLQNALSALKTRQTVNTLNRNQAVRQTGQQAAQDPGGYSYDEQANLLRQRGYVDAANRLSQQGREAEQARMQQELTGLKYVAARAPMVQDQESYESFKRDLEDKGLAMGGELPEQYSPELMRRLSGRAQERLSASDLVEVTGPQGNAILVPASQAVGMRAYQQGDEPSAREQEIQRYMQRGMSRAQAEDVAYGNYDVETDQFGNTYLVNTATGERRVLRGEGGGGRGGQQEPQQPRQERQQPESRPGMGLEEATEEGTGPFSAGRAAINAIVGPFVEGTPFPETARGRAAIRNFNQTAKQALVNSERFPVYEQKIVQQLLPDPDRVFNDPDAERQKLNELRAFLQRKKDRIQASMEEGGITTSERGSLANQISTIDRVLGLMEPTQQQGQQGGPGVRQPAQGEQQSQYTRDNPAQPTTREEYEALPSGAYFVDDEGLKRKP